MGAWRTVRITKKCSLRIDNGNLVIEDDANTYKISLPDTDSVIFENDRFMVSASVLSALAKHRVAVLFCDKFYMPVAIMHPYHQSSLTTRTLKSQLDMSSEFRDELWAEIIRVKILLQSEVLKFCQKDSNKVDRYLSQVRAGDRYNAEAKSARVYWQELFDDLKREADSLDIRNQALNYGYAIMRSLITRDLSVAGFLPAIGLWHDNVYNAFNLSDDMMEPFRPIVDIGIYMMLPLYDDEYLTPAFKRAIIALFDCEYVIYDSGVSSIRTASKGYIHSFKSAVMNRDISKMRYPSIDFRKISECF